MMLAGGFVAVFFCRRKIRDGADSVQSFDSNSRNASASEIAHSRDLVVNVAQFRCVGRKIHSHRLAEPARQDWSLAESRPNHLNSGFL